MGLDRIVFPNSRTPMGRIGRATEPQCPLQNMRRTVRRAEKLCPHRQSSSLLPPLPGLLCPPPVLSPGKSASQVPWLRAGRGGVNSGGTDWAHGTCRRRRRQWEGRGSGSRLGARSAPVWRGAARGAGGRGSVWPGASARGRAATGREGPSGLGN